jgi:hypothetical protein
MFIVVVIVSTFGNKLRGSFELENNQDEYRLIQNYLLNDSLLDGYHKPKLWIHSKYEKNARIWKSFYSRNSTDLNEPYIHLTIKTIIDHCGDDFNICLIDDDSFSKLIPSWNIKIDLLAEPMKSSMREYGMTFLLYLYGGMIVPNSFICLKNLKDLYDRGISQSVPFICENINHSLDILKEKKRMLFIPDTFFMGSLKNNPTIREMLEYLKTLNSDPHFSSRNEFLGNTNQWCLDKIRLGRMILIGGEVIGIKTAKQKTILLEDLMEDNFLDLHSECCGIYIPHDEVLKRIKYQWFAVLSSQEVLRSTAIISKYLKSSIVDTSNMYEIEN